MLSGQTITLADSVIISIVGMSVVLLELALLAVFIILLTKVLRVIIKEEKGAGTAASAAKAKAPAKAPVQKAVSGKPEAAGLAPALQAVPAVSEDDEDLIVIMTNILEESGIPAEEIVFRSIVRIQ